MILRALYDYYDRSGDMPPYGIEERQIGFILVLSKEGRFLRFEDNRSEDRRSAKKFFVAKGEGGKRTIAIIPNHLFDKSEYVLGYSEKDFATGSARCQKCFAAFKTLVGKVYGEHPDSIEMKALSKFYSRDSQDIFSDVSGDPLWSDITKDLNKKYSLFSFRIDGYLEIIAEQKELMPQEKIDDTHRSICLVTGRSCNPVRLMTPFSLPGSKVKSSLLPFQRKSGYDSCGKRQGYNAPISPEADFKITTSLKRLYSRDSRNMFILGTRYFAFWATKDNEAGKAVEEGLRSLFSFSDKKEATPNEKIERVRNVFKAIYSGKLPSSQDDKFCILGLTDYWTRKAVVHWSETTLREFASGINKHFEDMELVPQKGEKFLYRGLTDILRAVTRKEGKEDISKIPPSLPEALAKSIFQGTPYPQMLYTSCIMRIQMAHDVNIVRAGIIKAYLNRTEKCITNKIKTMLDKENTNQGYLCGRLFAVLEKIQVMATPTIKKTIRQGYMNSACSTPLSAFNTLLALTECHSQKIRAEGLRIYYEQLKDEIVSMLPTDGLPIRFDNRDRGRFYIGYYHQKQALYSKKDSIN